MARLRSTLSTVAHRSLMLLAGCVSGRPHSKWWWCLDIGYPLLAAEHSLCKAPWSGAPCQTTSTHSRTMSPLDSTWKPGFSLATSVLSALETLWQLRYINSQLPYHTITIPYYYDYYNYIVCGCRTVRMGQRDVISLCVYSVSWYPVLDSLSALVLDCGTARLSRFVLWQSTLSYSLTFTTHKYDVVMYYVFDPYVWDVLILKAWPKMFIFGA